MRSRAAVQVLSVLVLLCAAGRAEAQTWESIGTRAQGMAGAFVAVADDATASWWNPAGLASGSFFSALLEHSRLEEPEDPSNEEAARRMTTGGFAVGFPALGVSYYRFRISETSALAGTTGSSVQTRQEDGASGLGVQSHAISQFGVSVGQSITDHFVIATTFKIASGGADSETSAIDGDRLDAADDLDIDGTTRVDFDAGVMAVFGGLRFGLTARNLTTPDFGDDEHPLELDRQVRAGVAFMGGPYGLLNGLTLAGDADLTTDESVLGDARRVAGGAEAWLLNRHLGLRGGVSHNTVDRATTAWSSGVSVMLISGISIDAARTAGTDHSLRGWSGAVRFTY